MSWELKCRRDLSNRRHWSGSDPQFPSPAALFRRSERPRTDYAGALIEFKTERHVAARHLHQGGILRNQHFADLFWKRFRREYLVVLSERQKWIRPKRNLKPGDLVLVVDANSPRSAWPLARVIRTLPGRDERVRNCEIRTGQYRSWSCSKVKIKDSCQAFINVILKRSLLTLCLRELRRTWSSPRSRELRRTWMHTRVRRQKKMKIRRKKIVRRSSRNIFRPRKCALTKAVVFSCCCCCSSSSNHLLIYSP